MKDKYERLLKKKHALERQQELINEILENEKKKKAKNKIKR